VNRSLLLAGLASAVVASPVFAQSMDHSMHNMPGMTMPAKAAVKAAPKPARKAAAKPATKRKAPVRRAAPRRAPAAQAPAADPHAGHDMSGMQGMNMGGQQGAPAQDPHAGHDMSAMPGMGSPAAAGQDPHAGHDMSAMPGMAMEGSQAGAKVGTDLLPGNKPAPAPSGDHLADRFWGADAMASSRENDLRREHGGMTYYQVWLKSEGEGSFGKSLESAEVQALYSHALDPYWNLQAGVRYDFKPNPSRTYATIGIEGLAPYQFEIEGALFLSNKGDVLARAEGYYDQRITNYFVLQPRLEANFAAQDVRETGIGSGLTDLEAGLRLRYEGRREFAPYIGVSWERQFGDTARFSRARGDDTGGFSFVAGVRTWF
jgi:uncharacterized protein involved in copper resistance